MQAALKYLFCLSMAPLAWSAVGDSGNLLRLEKSDEAMGSTFGLVLYGSDLGKLEAAAAAAFEEVRRLDGMLSNYHPASEWSRVNRDAGSRPVKVSPELFQLLSECMKYSRQSGGAFDITVGPLMKVWGFYKGEGQLPREGAVADALRRVGYRHLRLDPAAQTAQFGRPAMELDPGGIGKGYAVDRIVEALKQRGVEIALVSAGGSSIYGMGAPPEEPRGWPAAIRDPRHPHQSASEVFLKDTSMSTSGSYEKFFFAGGRRFSHLMDPRTGHPAQGTSSVSVVARRTIDSEAWAKPYFVLGRAWTATHKPENFRVFLCDDTPEGECGWLGEQDFSDLKVEEIASGFPGGEGPIWSRQGFLIFSDYSKDRLYKYVPGKTPEVYREDSHGANGNAMDRQGRLYSCEYKARRVTRTDRKGRIQVFAGQFEGKRFNAPNDIVVRRDGHVYFSDPLFTPLDQRDLDFYGVYHVTPKGKIEAIARMKTRPNGVTLSPDGKLLYVANTDERNIRAYDLDRNGRASGERVVIENLPGGPDGIRTDVRGNLYIAARGVVVYSPDGRLLGKITPPVNPRNLAFGDSDLRTLYMAGNSIFRVRLDVPGSVQY